MRILVIGATGLIGGAVIKELGSRHEIIRASLNSGDIKVDIANNDSIEHMFKTINNLDAVVLATGKVNFRELGSMDNEAYQLGLQNKLMGQVNVVLCGQHYLNEGGSFTLTSGILSKDPIRLGTSASMVNGAIDSFVIAAAIEMPKRIRINCVSPTVITEALDKYAPYFRGYKPVSVANVSLAYSKSVEGLQTGQIYCAE